MNPTHSAEAAIFNHLAAAISSGELAVGDRLPTEMELADRFGATRMQAHAAVKRLQRQGLVWRNKRRGTVVLRRPLPGVRRRLKAQFTRRVTVIASIEKAQQIQWNLATLHGMHNRFARAGYEMACESLPEDASREDLKRLLARIADSGSNALLLLPEATEAELYLENQDLLIEYHDNVTIFERRGQIGVADWHLHAIRLDPFIEGLQVAEYVVRQGYQRVFYFASEPDHYWSARRLEGLQLGLRRCASPSASAPVLPTSADEAAAAVAREASRGRVPVVVGANDRMAVDFMEAATAAGLRLPEDYALVGFDNDIRYAHANLTTVASPLPRIDAILADFVLERLRENQTTGSSSIRLNSEIIERRTCPVQIPRELVGPATRTGARRPRKPSRKIAAPALT